MSTFAEWQPLYAEHGVVTFPVKGKRPAIRGYLQLSSRGSDRLSRVFADADALGFALRQNQICILDVDTVDDRVLADALSDHGQTPFVVRTGGGFHAYYRHSGERRRVRPWPGKPIDVLGEGFAVAPPSRASKGTYTVIQGTLDDLHQLPKMRGLAAPAQGNQAGTGLIGQGGRNEAVRNHCLRQACACDAMDDLLDVAKTFANERLDRTDGHPFTDADIFKAAKWAWDKSEAKENWFEAGRRVALTYEVVDALAASAPHAFALLMILKRNHWGREPFILAKAMADHLGWTLPRFKNARDHLVRGGLIHCIHRGGAGPNDPPIYGWGQGA